MRRFEQTEMVLQKHARRSIVKSTRNARKTVRRKLAQMAREDARLPVAIVGMKALVADWMSEPTYGSRSLNARLSAKSANNR